MLNYGTSDYSIPLTTRKTTTTKVYYSPTNAQAIVLKTVLKFTLK